MTARCAEGPVDYVSGLGVKARNWAQAEPAPHATRKLAP